MEDQTCNFCNGPVGSEPWGILASGTNICVKCMEKHLYIYKSACPDECFAMINRVSDADVSWFAGKRRSPKRMRQRALRTEGETSD